MKLADALKRLSELLPERFCRIECWPEAWWAVYDTGELGWVSMGDTDIKLARLEYALREEVEARGWDWDTAGGPQHQQCLGTVWTATPRRHHAFADTPTLALALALIAALEAEAHP